MNKYHITLKYVLCLMVDHPKGDNYDERFREVRERTDHLTFQTANDVEVTGQDFGGVRYAKETEAKIYYLIHFLVSVEATSQDEAIEKAKQLAEETAIITDNSIEVRPLEYDNVRFVERS